MKMLPDGKMTGNSTEQKEILEMVIIVDYENHGTSWEPNNVNMAGNAEVLEYVKEEDGVMDMMVVLQLPYHINLQDWLQIAEI